MFIKRIRPLASALVATALLTSQVVASIPSRCGCSESGCSESGCSESGCSESGCSESGCSESGCSARSEQETIQRMAKGTDCCSAAVAETHCNCENGCDPCDRSPHCSCGLTPIKVPTQKDPTSCRIEQFSSATPHENGTITDGLEHNHDSSVPAAPSLRGKCLHSHSLLYLANLRSIARFCAIMTCAHFAQVLDDGYRPSVFSADSLAVMHDDSQATS